MSNINWDAEDYAKNFTFVPAYGQALIDMLRIQDGMTCLDLGCGNGTLTRKLQEAGLLVTGMDDSNEQLALARKDYPDITFVRGNAVDFQLNEPVDVIFSNAVFHWIDKDKHPAMLSCVSRNLKAGGQFVFEMGGKGNNALIHESLARAFQKRGLQYHFPFYFPSIGEYTPLVEAAGMEVRNASLFDRKTKLSGENGLHDWIRMFAKAPFTGIPEKEREEIIQDVVEDLRPRLCEDGIWYADYVRLRCLAVKTA